MAKRKKTHNKNKRKQSQSAFSKIKLVNLVLAMMVITLTVTIAAYFIILKNALDDQQVQNEPQLKDEQLLSQDDEKRMNDYFEKFSREDQYEVYTEEFKKEYVPPKKEEVKEPKVQKPSLPKLTIIIDDVSHQSQVNKIKDIGYDITMSFMPPTKGHPTSAKIAQDIEAAMIHLPLQANSFKFEEENTLHVGDSYEKIEQRIKELRALYPKALYTNNHTGSKFTAHKQSMDYLMKALKKYGFIFVDSRTTGKSVAREVTKEHDMPYYVRNVFLDNEKDFNYIQGQLQQAVDIAKKRGYAIAIGHPYSITFEVLKKSKPMLKGLDMVLIDKIPAQ